MIRHRVEGGTVNHAKPAGLIATSWRHTTARAVGGRAPDPQLHSHVLLHAAVRQDGRVVAIDSRSWLVHRREVGAAYRVELARELTGLGFEVERGTGRGGRYFEIDGVPQSLIDDWSSRHEQVQVAIRQRLADQEHALEAAIQQGGADAADAAERLEILRRTGLLAPREERLMAAITRTAKAPLTHADLDKHWRRAGARHGLDDRALGQLRASRAPLAPAPRQHLLAGLTEFDATFPARDARAVALERSAGAAIEEAVEQLRELRDAGEIIVLADGTGTTREHRGRERTTVAIAQRLAAQTVPPIPAALVARETERLGRELQSLGGALSGEQQHAIQAGCGTAQLVVIEGQAGTGKSTTLTGIARAHQADGRELIVTSTAALAAERLARELAASGVTASPYSTIALQAAIDSGHVTLGPQTTVIHDEAALASTLEQRRLLEAIETSGARLIEVGDRAQSQPVGAGGLWPYLQDAAFHAGAYVELTRNQRALDPADRRAQAGFRAGEHEQAIRNYDGRDRVHLTSDQARAEDLALETAYADHTAGKRTIVIAQTSNERLDELNARAQAIRRQHGQLGNDAIDVPGRPYQLHAGDEVQIRHTINHPDHGPLRNGTTASVAKADSHLGRLELELGNGERIALDEQQIGRADLRLAYVQHPFPAQGQTTDTAHVIVCDHATAEGTYVAITRARQRTALYADTEVVDEPDGTDRLKVLAERVSRAEPELPSIRVPLKHETSITTEPDQRESTTEQATRAGLPEPTLVEGLPGPNKAAEVSNGRRQWPHTREPDGLEREALEPHREDEPTRSTPSRGWEP